MNFVWEIMLHAREQGYRDGDLFFAQAAKCSPWYEQAFACLNEETIWSPTIEINSLYRFSAIFQNILHQLGGTEYQTYLFDVGIHLLADREMLSGIRLQDFYVKKLMYELGTGVFGRSTSQAYYDLPMKERRELAALLLSQFQTGSSLLTFRKAISTFYPNCLLYQFRAEPQTLLLYVGRPSSEAPLVNMLQELFLPIEYTVRVFWTHHFGVLDVDATLHWDAIEIF